MQQYIGKSTYSTGDINLAASLMAVGIPLDPAQPVRIIESSDGRSYGSFTLGAWSEDGKESTESIMDHWAKRSGLPDDHPINAISQFIADRPAIKMSAADWLEYAMSWLSERGHQVAGVRCIEDIPYYVQPLPQSVPSYILAYVYNRQTCFLLYNDARRAVHMRNGESHVLIDHKLPMWQRNELLSRLQG
jgi:hypothetical protein